jgi:hypothetical protein
MGVRNRKPLHERAATDSVVSYDETGAEVGSTENHGNLTQEDEEAILKLTDALPKKAKLKGRHPSLSRNPSVANYLHKVLFVSEEEAHGRKHFAPGARRRAILLLGIIIGMGLAMLLMGQTKDVAYMEALSHYFHEFDLASMVPTGMIPEELIGNMSALFRPDILTEEAFHPGEELRQVYGYKPKYPVKPVDCDMHLGPWVLDQGSITIAKFSLSSYFFP